MKSWMKWTMVAAVAAGLAFQGASALAETETVDGVEWSFEVEDGEAMVTGADPAEGALSIPSELGGCPVVAIEEYAFEYCDELTSVTIPDSVTSIGNFACYACYGMTSVTIGDSVTSIGDYAFCGCHGLTSVTIPDSVTSIGHYAFDTCSGLNAFSVASGNPAYQSASGLLLTKDGATLVCGVNGDVVIPDSVTSIGGGRFPAVDLRA